MPHSKNRLKLTGDTHPPEVGMDDGSDDDTMAMFGADDAAPPRVYADGWVPPAGDERSEAQPGPAAAAVEKVEALPRQSPWLAIGAALAVGWLLTKALRR